MEVGNTCGAKNSLPTKKTNKKKTKKKKQGQEKKC